jgi:hypothetical protein
MSTNDITNHYEASLREKFNILKDRSTWTISQHNLWVDKVSLSILYKHQHNNILSGHLLHCILHYSSHKVFVTP